MPRRYFNWKLAIVLLIGLVVLGVTAYGLRQWRRSNRSERGLILGNKAYGEHRYEEAALQLGRYLAVERNDVPILLKYADAQLSIRPLKSDNIMQVVAAYRIALRENENNSEVVTKLTELYLEMGMPGETELIATRYLKTNKDLRLHRMLAVALARQRKFNEAATELKGIIKEHPQQILAYEVLGQLAEQRPEDFPESAANLFDKAVKNNPSLALVYIIRAAFHLRSNDRPKALADLEQAEKLDLSDTIIRLRLAAECINANVFDKAVNHLEAVQVAEPTNKDLWRIWATLALKSSSKAMMLKVAETGLKELSSQPWDFMLTAAELYIECGRLDRARDCVSKLRQKEIALPTIEFLEGLLADRQGRPFEAVKCWYRAIQSGNKSPKVRLALASTLLRSGDNQSALRQLHTLVSERPNLFDGRLALARLLAKGGNWAQAEEHARIAMQNSPGSLDAAILHIQARMKLLEAGSTGENDQIWQDIEEQLAALEKATDSAFIVKASQLQLAVLRSQFSKAQKLLNDMKNSGTSPAEVAMAEVKLLIAQDKSDEAILKLYDVVGEFPDSVSPLRHLAILLVAKDKTKECEKIIKDALTRIEQSAARRDLGLLLAGFYNRWDEQEKRYQLLNSLEKELPDDILVQRELLKCKKVVEDPIRAQQLVDRIKTMEGEGGWQWRYEQAKIWVAQDDFKDLYSKIVSLLKENLLVNLDDQDSRMLLAHTYDKAGELRIAISTYRQALNRSPRDLRIIVAYVHALYKAEEYGLAYEILQRAADEKLSHPELKKLEVQSYLRRGELASAGDILEDLLTDDPNDRAMCLSLALLRIRQNKFVEAGRLLDKLKNQDPNSLQIIVAQIELNVHQGKAAEALLLCDDIVNSLKNASAYILRARTFVSLGRPNKAIEDFDYATTIEPNSVEAWVAKSDFYRSIDQPDNAIADIQQALSLVSNNVEIQKRAITLLLASGNPRRLLQGRTILDEAIKENPEEVELRLYKARSLLTEGTAPAFDNAQKILQKTTEEQPKVTKAWVLLGQLLMKKAEYGEAVNIAWRGLAHTPKNKELLLLKFRAEKELSMDLAIPTLKLLYEMDTNDVDMAVLLADTYVVANEYERAVNLLKKQLVSCSDAPDERKVNIILAGALYKSGDKQQAQKIFDSLYQSAPNDPTPLLVQARLLRDDKLWDRLSRMVAEWCRNHPKDTRTPVAVAVDLMANEDSQAKRTAENILRKILDRDANSLPAIGSLAMLLQATGRHAESAELYKRVLAIQPDNVIAINNLAWILCEQQGKHQQALQLAMRGLDIAPNYVDLVDTCGVAHYRLRQYDQAVQCFTKCLKLYPDGIPAATAAYFHLGRALARLAQKEQAMENLKKAVELNTKIGGLSVADATEMQRLLEELSRES